jgi:hypothetical protein
VIPAIVVPVIGPPVRTTVSAIPVSAHRHARGRRVLGQAPRVIQRLA